MTIHLTRDSVAASDDLTSSRFIVPDSTTLPEVLQLVVAQSYLASIAGGKATWVAELQGKPIVVLAQQWQRPVFLSSELSALPVKKKALQLHFRYYTQQNPEEVLSALRQTIT
ncbi:hypothetical protein [Hymenobacter crusticola]|uniref:Uncharacterized protein n=1 Tax=Hymenobacter crusticola TaxID=1770526 RepID=A0A243WDK5_9BACT|nr:hypothetical protein [Hymenobacter crusticola]OUJ73173.1 hypothetical protein BXP70_15210 [Hymenobacter crusticola]